MTKDEALKMLKYYQDWRMGADIPQPNLSKASEALDFAINFIKSSRDTND